MQLPQKEPLKKVQVVALSYYARKDIQQAIFEFCKNRETVANFNNKFFAKRPDVLDYPSDIFNSAKTGATSFHCSEEIWQNPLDINTNMTPQQYNEIKIGWDLLIDIDSKYFDYSKIAARLLIATLEHHGIKNIGIKYSGSKGFHIIVPSKAFPKEVAGELTKDKFPEWPRAIAGYLFNTIKDSMNQEILKLSTREELEAKGELISSHLCPNCKKPTEEKFISIYKCPNFKCKSVVKSMKANRKILRCPSCNGNMDKVSEEKIFFCNNCKINTINLIAKQSSFGGVKVESKQSFEEEVTTKSTQNAVDVVLVSPRHLFRAPYSLHEKTSFSSIVISKEELNDFKPTDADPLKIKNPKPYLPNSIQGEGANLLLEALDWAEKKSPPSEKKFEGASIDLKGLTIIEDMFPQIIHHILKGIKDDGRKRALSLLLSFFTSLEFPKEWIEEKINDWNTKNYHPLKEGYIKSQISWHMTNKRLPPNYDKPIYKEFGFKDSPEPGIKNPINYTIKMAMKAKGQVNNLNDKHGKNKSSFSKGKMK